mmetsp:Transcript_33549/g.37664  ORF Transcript_33549/g.37664 Transcript_33549/m.37664 type:complete len:81 (-) Transcript_33549:192-434(-)
MFISVPIDDHEDVTTRYDISSRFDEGQRQRDAVGVAVVRFLLFVCVPVCVCVLMWVEGRKHGIASLRGCLFQYRWCWRTV